MKKTILTIAAAIMMLSCEIHAELNTEEPIVVTDVLGNNKYRCDYKAQINGQTFYMVIITRDTLNVGDTLTLSRKSNEIVAARR